jgi:gluconolactonase
MNRRDLIKDISLGCLALSFGNWARGGSVTLGDTKINGRKNITAGSLKLEIFAQGLQFPEGPVALAGGSILVVEIQRGTLTHIGTDGHHDIIAYLGGGPNGAAIGPDGMVYVTNDGGCFTWQKYKGFTIPGLEPTTHKGGCIQRINLTNGKFETLYDACDGRRLISPNDLVFDKFGGFWFTDYGAMNADRLKLGALYYARTDGSSIKQVRGGMISPNGVRLSPDGRILYIADTYLQRLWAFNIIKPGEIAEVSPMQPGRIVANLQGYQLIDSLAVQADGKICVGTLFHNSGITRFSPDGQVEHFPMPDIMCTNLCFGGDDLRDVWITASGSGQVYKTRWPSPGLKLAFNA